MAEHQHQRGKQRVLADHKRVGQRFIPPFVHKLGNLGNLQDVKWVDAPLPELLWLGLLNHQYGLKRGAELTVEVARATAAEIQSDSKIWLGPISAYAKLSDHAKLAILRTLESRHCLNDLRIALGPLVSLYPECPLAFLYQDSAPPGDKSDHLVQLKEVIANLFDKTTKQATLMQANAIYIAFVTDMLVVSRDTSLANFPAVAEYPDSEEGRSVGAAVRASILIFFGQHYDSTSTWPGYFWNRGLEIDGCLFGNKEDHE